MHRESHKRSTATLLCRGVEETGAFLEKDGAIVRCCGEMQRGQKRGSNESNHLRRRTTIIVISISISISISIIIRGIISGIFITMHNRPHVKGQPVPIKPLSFSLPELSNSKRHPSYHPVQVFWRIHPADPKGGFSCRDPQAPTQKSRRP